MMEKVTDTIFFNWDKVVKESNGSSLKIMSLLKKIYGNVKLRPKYAGNSFLLNPVPLFNDLTASESEKASYVGVAALRNYFDYKYLKDTRLFIPLYTIPPDKIQSNRLLRLDKDYIYFKYEEN